MRRRDLLIPSVIALIIPHFSLCRSRTYLTIASQLSRDLDWHNRKMEAASLSGYAFTLPSLFLLPL